MIFKIFALLIMILFYSIYFGKMIIQKRQGIKTRQLGKGKNQNVSNGIYKISRNPVFVGFDLMYIGICLLYCNFLTIAFSLFDIIMLHFQILKEEKYIIYKNKVFRYIGIR